MSTGVLSMNTDGVVLVDEAIVGNEGYGHWDIYGKTTVRSTEAIGSGDGVSLTIAQAAISEGIVDLTGSQVEEWRGDGLFTDVVAVGVGGKGRMNISLGSVTTTGEADVGNLEGSSGIVSIDNEPAIWTIDGALNVGNEGFGQIRITRSGELRTMNDSSVIASSQGATEEMPFSASVMLDHGYWTATMQDIVIGGEMGKAIVSASP